MNQNPAAFTKGQIIELGRLLFCIPGSLLKVTNSHEVRVFNERLINGASFVIHPVINVEWISGKRAKVTMKISRHAGRWAIAASFSVYLLPLIGPHALDLLGSHLFRDVTSTPNIQSLWVLTE
jgi:hypothetical protein